MLAIVQARLSSKRLPGKALMMLGAKNILEHTINRIKHSKKISSVVVATSNCTTDHPIAQNAKAIGTEVYRGDLNDVSRRLLGAAKTSGAKSFVRISADSPFLDWRIIDQAIDIHEVGNADLVTNIFPRTFPKGQSVEIINTRSLDKICKIERSSDQMEHVTPYFYENYINFKIFSFTSGQNQSDSIHCIDNSIDFEIASRVIRESQDHDLSWQEYETLFSKHRKII